MANQILRPTADGTYTAWDGWALPGPTPHTPLYDLINETDYVVGTGDDTYISTAVDGATATVLLSDATAGSWPRATRIRSIRVVAVVRQIGGGCDFSFRLRGLDQNLDSPVQTLTSTTYTEVGCTLNLGFNVHAWDIPTINRMEAGLVFASGDEMRCTKLEVYLHYEDFPHYTLMPEANGALQQWSPIPSGTPNYMTCSGVYDGDLSYLANSVVNDQSTFVIEDLPASLHPANIDRVQVKALVKNVGSVVEEADVLLRSAGLVYHGGTNTTSTPILPNDKWALLTEQYLNDPNVAWPSGHAAATDWTVAEVAALQIGVENSGGGDFRCTSVGMEVWLAPTPITSIDLYPTADGYHQDQSSIVGAATAWQATDEVVPDNATTHIVLDANTLGISAYTSSDVGGAGSVPAGERIYSVELRYRVRLDNLPHSSALVAPLVRDTVAKETYVATPQLIEGMAATWFDVKQDLSTNPHTGAPWTNLAEVTALEFGFVVLEGAMLLSRTRVQVHTCVDYRAATVDPIDAELTDAAVAMITRSQTDGTIFGVTEFSVGTGGYTAATPDTVTAVAPADIALINEVYRAGVDRIEYEAFQVDYWCRVPRETAAGGIGELALWAEIFWSPVPGETGTKFLHSLAHHPCQTRHPDDVHFYRCRLNYWDLGPELLVDGGAEAAGVAAWTATAAALTKEVTAPYEGAQVLRVTQSGAPAGKASQAILTVGTLYLFRAQARCVTPLISPVVENPSGTAVWTGTTSPSWQEVNELHVAVGDTSFWAGLSGAAGADFVDFDALSVREVLSYDFLTHGPELLGDGDQEATTTVAWSVGNSATLSKQTTSPYEGTQVLRIAYNAVNDPYAAQTVLIPGTLYRARGFIRSDGTGVPKLLSGTTQIWLGSAAATTRQEFDAVFAATATDLRFQCVIGVAGYCEIDLVSCMTVTLPT